MTYQGPALFYTQPVDEPSDYNSSNSEYNVQEVMEHNDFPLSQHEDVHMKEQSSDSQSDSPKAANPAAPKDSSESS